jgi:hypothetical protein
MSKMINGYPVKFEEEVYEKVKVLAKIDHRSINGEIDYIVNQFIDNYEQIHGPIKINF